MAGSRTIASPHLFYWAKCDYQGNRHKVRKPIQLRPSQQQFGPWRVPGMKSSVDTALKARVTCTARLWSHAQSPRQPHGPPKGGKDLYTWGPICQAFLHSCGVEGRWQRETLPRPTSEIKMSILYRQKLVNKPITKQKPFFIPMLFRKEFSYTVKETAQNRL